MGNEAQREEKGEGCSLWRIDSWIWGHSRQQGPDTGYMKSFAWGFRWKIPPTSQQRIYLLK